MSPETGPSTIPQFSRGGRYVGIFESLPLPDWHSRQSRGTLRESIVSRIIFIAAISCGLIAGAPALAQSTNSAPSELDQIVVVGARIPLTLNQIGNATTVISRNQIEQRQARYVTDLLRSVPGFSVSHTGVAGAQTQVRVRGSEANHVLVLIDGVRANDPATGDEFRWEHLATGNIERIEIVRGPQSALWGSDAIAAVVHVITRDGRDDSNLATYIEGGTNSALNLGLSGSVQTGKWSLNGGLEHLSTDGSNISRVGAEDDDSDVITASVSARLDATEAFTLNMQLRAVDAYSQFDPVDFIVTGLPTDGDLATETENVYASIGGTLKTRGKLTHHLNARYYESDNRNLTDGIQNSSSASDRTTLAYQIDIDLGDDRLALALEHEQTSFEQRGEIIFGDPNQNQDMDVSSIVAEYQGFSYERLSWLISARYDDNSDFDNAVNGRLSLAYSLSDATKLRGAIGTGQKNPTFIERYGFFPGQFIGNPDLLPERSVSYDVGLDHGFIDGALLLQVTLFRQDLRDEIDGFVFDPVTFLSTAENKDGKSERSGVELGAQWTINEFFGFNASYTYTDSTEENFAGDEVRELRRPRHAGSLAANFQSANDRLKATLAADYGGSREDMFFPPFPALPETVTLESFWLLDLTAQYQLTRSINIFARGTNLLDEDYEQVYGYQTPGRAGYAGVRVNFGR
jgi:vitamin B12 transporter